MSRRRFLKRSALLGAATLAGRFAAAATAATTQPPSSRAAKRRIRILMGGYGPPSTGFSLALKRIGDRLEARFGDEVEVKYVYNILDLGYRGEDILWLVEQGVLTLGYQSSSYLTDRVLDLGAADLPFLFSDARQARSRHGRTPRPGADRQNRSGHELPDSRLLRKRLPPCVESPPAGTHPCRHEGHEDSRPAQSGAGADLRAAGRRPEDHGPLGGHRGRQSRHARRAGKSVRQHGDLRRAQVPSLPFRDESFLPVPPDLRAPADVRCVAARAAGRHCGRRCTTRSGSSASCTSRKRKTR